LRYGAFMTYPIPPQILRRETLYSGYMTVERLLLRMPGGNEVWREVETHGDAIAVLPFDADRRAALTVRLHRVPVLISGDTDPLEEACAGMIDAADADPATAARREAMEELGVRLFDLEPVGRVWTSPGVVSERCSLFLAPFRPQDRIAAGGGVPEEHEGIEVLERSLADLAKAADDGAIVDAKLLLLVQALRLRRPELFAA
jgi:nudix-type nucleoside diphosphatase (YffH/AdpP family)